jgi:hypothetical protein
MSMKTHHANVGDLAEDEFAKWCTFNGLLHTKAQRDRMGWDYFVEFPIDSPINQAMDETREQIKTLCQIKSTRGQSKTVRGKLSAFKLLVDADMAAFIIHIAYDSCNSIVSAALLHIGTILRKIRAAERHGNTDLHKITVSLPLNIAKILHRDGSNLKQEMSASITKTNAEYIDAKASFRKSCGYDEVKYKGTFTLLAGTSPSEFVDLLIGKIPSIQVSSFTVSKGGRGGRGRPDPQALA